MSEPSDESLDPAVDYEAEYDNRARTPEHPEIIAGWRADSEAYARTKPPRVVAYGPGERERIDLYEAGPGPAVMFLHGGYWQALGREWFGWTARGLNARGITVAVPSYDLCPAADVARIEAQAKAAIERTAALTGAAVAAAGHSAGGHLAARLAVSTPRTVAAVYAISGLFDLRPLVVTKVNAALGLDPAEARRLSPLFSPPTTPGLTVDAVVGGAESAEYLRQSRTLTYRWAQVGAKTRFEARGTANHFTVIAPLGDPDSDMVARLADLRDGRG